jgi:hypothetical protein
MCFRRCDQVLGSFGPFLSEIQGIDVMFDALHHDLGTLFSILFAVGRV